jgi:hypothetical protein
MFSSKRIDESCTEQLSRFDGSIGLLSNAIAVSNSWQSLNVTNHRGTTPLFNAATDGSKPVINAEEEKVSQSC